MARYNSSLPAVSITSPGTLVTPGSGLFTEFNGTAPYTVNIPDPTVYFGTTQTFFNNTSGVVSLQSPSGTFTGPGGSGTATQTIVSGGTVILASDGTNYVQVLGSGGPLSGTSLTATGNVNLNGANATININPTGTGSVNISPTGAGSSATVTVNPTSGCIELGNTTNSTIAVKGNSIFVGRMTQITANMPSSNYTYSGAWPTTIIDGNKTTSSITYDGNNRITGYTETITDANSGTVYSQSRTISYTTYGDPIIT
jgi:hypothetical protein